MNNFRKREHWLIIAGYLLIIGGCAQQGAPTGGPQDEDPPVVVKATPENYSSNFESGKIMITFDEYLDMSNFTQELVVSPPMEEKPLIKLRNKTLIIEFGEELKKDVTYTFNFGEGIKDLNEKNMLLNYEYVFSTGDVLDSLSVKGILKNAFDLSIPESPIYIMLYHELNDSLPLMEIPYYVGRTDKEGNFEVNNLKAGIYKLFVLKDGNSNFLFDLPNEQIAFLDSSLLVDGDYFRRIQAETAVVDTTIQTDTLAFNIDTTGMSSDSIVMLLDSLEKLKPDLNSINIDLFMFSEDPVNQFISDYSRKKRNTLITLFNLPLSDSFSFEPLYPADLSFADFIIDFGHDRDTLTIWTGDTTIASMDTIRLAMNYIVLDTLGKPVLKKDTLQYTFREPKSKKNTGKEKKQKKSKASLKISTISNKGKLDIIKDLNFTLEYPVKKIDSSLFELYIIPDTIDIPVTVFPFIDTTHFRRVKIRKQWKEEGSYRIVLYPGAIEDIYGLTNDTMDIKFSIRPLSKYGKINLTVENVEDTVMIQILRKGKIVRSREITASGTYIFEFLKPETYRIKFVHDKNSNGKWDTGKYLLGLQPERVEFLFKDIKVRANWDHDIKYSIGSNDSVPAIPKKNEKDKPLFQ